MNVQHDCRGQGCAEDGEERRETEGGARAEKVTRHVGDLAIVLLNVFVERSFKDVWRFIPDIQRTQGRTDVVEEAGRSTTVYLASMKKSKNARAKRTLRQNVEQEGGSGDDE